MNKRANSWLTDMYDDLHEQMETNRNRERIQEIFRFVDNFRNKGDKLFTELHTAISAPQASRRGQKSKASDVTQKWPC